ncbi:MAG: hypothetical protein CEE38_04440 [Planctomycetes bacterium B3_Pla]|nr:MAG: hypothetical protein CEE38_04440 [Planctomycetes bacterium B3_Pla]
MVKAEQYKEIVRRVLAAMGYEPTYGNFRLWDPLLDWRATTKLMDQRPARTALCHILDGNGEIVRDQGRPVVVARDIEASSEAEAVGILSRSSHAFVRWWPSDSPNGSGSNRRAAQGNYLK